MTRNARPYGLTSIVAVGLDGAIGVGNALPWNLKSDLRFFKQTTVSNVVIMGRKTYESIGGCLKGRQNLVLSHRITLFDEHEGCNHSHSLSEALYLRSKYPLKDAFIIGGGMTYTQFAPFVDRYLITLVNGNFPSADAHFDKIIIGDEGDWERREIEIERSEAGDDFEFSIIELIHKHPDHIAFARNQLVEDFSKRNHLLVKKAFRRKCSQKFGLGNLVPAP